MSTTKRADEPSSIIPSVPKSEARRKALRFVLSRFFEDSPELLVLNLLEPSRNGILNSSQS